MHEVLLNVGPRPSSNASTSENVRPVALNSAAEQFPLGRPSKPVGASVTALTCGPVGPSSACIATARPGSCAAGSADGSLDGEHDATISEPGSSKVAVTSWRNAFMTLFLLGFETMSGWTSPIGHEMGPEPCMPRLPFPLVPTKQHLAARRSPEICAVDLT